MQRAPSYSMPPRQTRPMLRGARIGSRHSFSQPARPIKLATRHRDEEDIFCTGLTFGEVDPSVIRLWVLFQCIALLFHWMLWSEIRSHLDDYETAVDKQCSSSGNSMNGVCLGPMWNLSAWQDVVLEGEHVREAFDFDFRHRKHFLQHRHHARTHSSNVDNRLETEEWRMDDEIEDLEAEEKETETRLLELKKKRNELRLREHNTSLSSNASRVFDFVTFSKPPTFIIVVDPVSASWKNTPPEANLSAAASERMESVTWSLKVVRVDPLPKLKELDFRSDHTGADVATFEDLSFESAESKQVRWRATLTSLGSASQRIRFKLFVEDSLIPHLADMRRSDSNCNFIRAWKAFNQQYQGKSHEALALSRLLLGICLPLGAFLIFVVHKCSNGPGVVSQNEEKQEPRADSGEHVENGDDCYCFHVSVLIKFVIVDVPQQACIVLYLLGWYETEGLRCQLCLFHPDRCLQEHPFKLATSAALLSTLLSAGTHQLLVRPVIRRQKTEDDVFYRVLGRVMAICLSTLPVTTGTFWATGALLTTPRLTQIVFFLPCAVGWLTVVALFARWFWLCCSECD